MKKLFYIAFGLCAILASCAKEIDPIPAENPGNNEKTVLPANIPASLTALYAEEASQNEVEAVPKVKTSYGSDGSFSWVLNDEVALYFVDNLDAPENQGWISYEASTVNGATATFTVKDGQTAKATALSEYKNTGLAIYPTSIARPASANSESCSTYGSPFVTVKSTVSGNASDIILIGSADATPVFHFKTAMGVLKVTITGIPAQAAALQLISNDQDSYPLCGDFKLNIDGDLEIKKADYLKYYGYHTGANKLTIDLSSEGDIASRDFYFNIPTGNYAKGAFTIKIVDGSGNALLEKTLNKAFEFERNDLVSTPSALANEWVTLGTGKYADYWMQGYNGVVEDMWDVTIQQSTTDKRYRIVNPYAQGVNMPQTLAHDDYLYFSISGEGTVTFTDCITGVKASGYDSSTERNLKLVYVQTAKNTILAGDASTPKVIQLSPRYEQAGNSSWNWPRNGKPHLVRIVMPDYVSTYTTSITSKTDATNGNFSASATNAPVYTRFFISASNFPKAIYDAGSTDFDATTTESPFDVCWSNKTGTYNNTYSAADMASKFTSGKLYICWITYSGSTIYTIGTKPFYFLRTADQTVLVGTYSFTSIQALFYYYRTAWTDVTSQDVNNLVLSASDNALKGNIQITKIFGFDKSGGTSSYVVNGPIGGATSTLTGTFTSGYGAYGTYTNSSSSMVFTDDDTTPFMNYNGNGVFVRGVTHNNKVSTTNKSFGFTYSKDETTATLTASPAALMELWMGGTNYNADRSVIYVTNNSSFTPTALVATRSLE